MPIVNPLSNSWIEAFLVRLAYAGYQAAILAVLVLLVTGILRNRLPARWRFALWLVVFIRLALPITPSAPWSLFRLIPSVAARPLTPTPSHSLESPPTAFAVQANADNAPSPVTE